MHKWEMLKEYVASDAFAYSPLLCIDGLHETLLWAEENFEQISFYFKPGLYQFVYENLVLTEIRALS